MAARKLAPIHPGEVLFEEFLTPLDLSQHHGRHRASTGALLRHLGSLLAEPANAIRS